MRASSEEDAVPLSEQIGIQGVHHVAVIVENLERSMAFYQGTYSVRAPCFFCEPLFCALRDTR